MEWYFDGVAAAFNPSKASAGGARSVIASVLAWVGVVLYTLRLFLPPWDAFDVVRALGLLALAVVLSASVAFGHSRIDDD